MKNRLQKLISLLKNNLPLILIIIIALVIAVTNVKPSTYYSGWDNIHAEFNFPRYVQQVFFGAWLEHQSLGAPAAQGHLAEIPRLPILWLLVTLFPANLVRYLYIFLYFLIGGIGAYFYLKNYWLKTKTAHLKTWLAGLGGIFYLLHILTLQQFYISFEMFMAQFAFLPFLLIAIHKLDQKINLRTLLIFIGVQLLIAPSGHTSTVFYLGVLLSMLYGFFLKLKQHRLFEVIKFTFLIGFMSFISNAYWILPNLYYSLNNAQYVQQSRENQLFGPESVWSVRETGSIKQFLKGTHYLFTWKDYSFADQDFDYIFNEWEDHLNQPLTESILISLGVITFLGVFITLYSKKLGNRRFAIVLYYLFCLTFIWIDLFPTSQIVDWLYQSSSFLEAFRNPFTKLSILYSFTSLILFIQAVEFLLTKLKPRKLSYLGLTALVVAIIYSAWPSFQGHFISEKLRIIYPDEYQQLFDFLQTQDAQSRILQLPQLSHAGWVYHDWSFIKTGNGYQGMGFIPFGVNQAVVNRDSDRWVETSDFFYHELKYALDSYNPELIKNILHKYRVDLVIVDETKIQPSQNHDYQRDHQLLLETGLEIIWQDNFLSVYQLSSTDQTQEIIVPQTLTSVAAKTDRIRIDQIYPQLGDYLIVDDNESQLIYPFSDLASKKINQVNINQDKIEIAREVPPQNYTLNLPGISGDTYFTPAEISYQDNLIKVNLPNLQLELDQEIIQLPGLADFEFELKQPAPTIALFFNRSGVVINQGETIYPIIPFDMTQNMSITYTDAAEIDLNTEGEVDASAITITPASYLNFSWEEFTKEISFSVSKTQQIKIISKFPVVEIDLAQNPSTNCSQPLKGSILTTTNDYGIAYQADSYGINCNGYVFPYLSPAYSYVMNIAGQTLQGRGIKFFLNYSDEEVLFEDYLMQDRQYDQYLTLHRVSCDPKSRFTLNWETRSFGRVSRNKLTKIQLAPLPLEYLAQLKLQVDESPITVDNQLEIIDHHKYLNSLHLVEFNCQQDQCYLGLDQSYDDLWLAWNPDDRQLLSHLRLNNWANLWQVAGEDQIIIIYLPELISLFSLGILGIILVILIFKLPSLNNKSVSKKDILKSKTKRHLRGK